MSLLVKEMLTMGEKQLMDSDIADATRDCKILYCYMMDIPFSKIILEYQEVLQDRLCDKYFELIQIVPRIPRLMKRRQGREKRTVMARVTSITR